MKTGSKKKRKTHQDDGDTTAAPPVVEKEEESVTKKVKTDDDVEGSQEPPPKKPLNPISNFFSKITKEDYRKSCEKDTAAQKVFISVKRPHFIWQGIFGEKPSDRKNFENKQPIFCLNNSIYVY